MNVLVGFALLFMLIFLCYMVYRLFRRKNIHTFISICFQLFSISIAGTAFYHDVEATDTVQLCYLALGIITPLAFLAADFSRMLKKIKEKGVFEGLIEVVDKNRTVGDGYKDIRPIKGGLPVSLFMNGIDLAEEPVKKNFKKLLLQAQSHAGAGEYAKASGIYGFAIKLVKSSWELYFNHGNLCYLNKSYGEAEHSYERALSIFIKSSGQGCKTAFGAGEAETAGTGVPPLSEAGEGGSSPAAALYFNLGNAKYRLKKYEAALEAYENALKIDPELTEAEENMVRLYLKQGEGKRAAEAVDDLLHKAGRRPEAVFFAGDLYFEMADYVKAVECYNQCLALEPAHAEAAEALGKALFRAGSFSEAVKAYEKLEALRPGDFSVYYNKGTAYYRLGEKESAARAFKRAVEVNPESYRGHFNLAAVLDELGKEEEATSALKRVIALKPDFVEAYNNLGILLSTSGRPKEAVDIYEKGLKENPGEYSLYFNMGITLSETGRHADAVEAFRSALEINGEEYELYCHLGAALMEVRSYDEAIEVYKKAIKVKPPDSELFYNLASVYSLLRKHEIAVENLRRAVELNDGLRSEAKWDRAFDSMRSNRRFREIVYS